MHPNCDPIGVQTHDLQIMTVQFMSLRRLTDKFASVAQCVNQTNTLSGMSTSHLCHVSKNIGSGAARWLPLEL